MLIGFGGHLVSEHVLERRVDTHADGQMSNRTRTALVRWRTNQQLLGPASSVRTMLEAAATPFVRLLGFPPPTDIAVGDDVCAATLPARSTPVAIVVSRWGERLDPLWRRATLEATARGAAWCLLFNGTHVRLVHAVRVFSRRFVEFDLDAVVDDERATAAMWMLLAPAAFERTSGDIATVASIVEQSQRHASTVCRALRHGVLQASGDVLNTLVARPSAGSLNDAFEQALTIVYRILFLLFAEARALVPAWHPVYRQSYSLQTLTGGALSGSHTGLWDALRAISRLAHSGCVAGSLKVTPFNGRLFAPSRTPLAERPNLDDEAARRSLVALSTRPAPDGEGREPIAYRDLGVEQLGAVYETLLDYRPEFEQRPRGAPPVVTLVPGSGVRKATGTFYTPQSLSGYLIRRTLAPLVRERTPEAILDLKVLDPSMGSGAFLVGACRYLADAYENALVRSGACLPSDLGPDERARIKRTVAERCLYGVDINPMAVQLARLSLWLATLAHDRPLSFLDHHLVVGDSVLGTWVSCLRHAPAGRTRQSSTLPLFDGDRLSDTLRHVLPVRFRLEQGPNDTPGQVRDKERALAALNREDTLLAKWKRIADLWCGRWFAADLRTPAIFAPLCDAILAGRCELPPSTAEALLGVSARVAERRRFFHWELEFPEVFFDASGARRPDGGFDAVIGNPPWDMVRAGEERGDGASAERRAGTSAKATAPAEAQRAKAGVWGGAPRDIVRFTRDAGIYSAQSDGHANSYQLFLERSIALAKPGGRLGLVLPAGLASDHGSAALRRLLFSRCAVDGIVGFDNRRALFPIHRSTRFVLVSAERGAHTASIDCRLGEVDPAVLDRAGDSDAAGPPGALRLTMALIEKISGSSLAIPDLRTTIDVAIAERAAALFPPVGDPSGWRVQFGRELNATEDKAAFGPPGRGLPVVEGKLIEPFRVHADSARCSLSPREAFRRLGQRPRRARLCYRDVASARNRVTLIAAVLPAGAVSTHTVFCLKTALPLRAQWFLCGMFNSLVVNYFVRLRVTTHVTTSIVERLPVPRQDHAGRAYGEIAAIARALARRDDASLWAQLNASVARLYALNEEEFAYVLGTFPLIPAADREAVMQTLRKMS
jgi:hypothetical protein